MVLAAVRQFDWVYGEVKPADKLERVREFQRQGRVVAVAGDGMLTMIAAMAKSLRSASVIANALRLRTATLPDA